jgi:hypothetical protein
MQSYNDKFELPKKSYKTPAPTGLVLVAGKKEEALNPAMQEKYCSGTGKAMHAMQHSKPEMLNAVQAKTALVRQGNTEVELPLYITDKVADNCVVVASGFMETALLGNPSGEIEVRTC